MLDPDIILEPTAQFDTLLPPVTKCLLASPGLGPLVDDPKIQLDNLLVRTCLEYGIHPKWVLVTLQRERGLLRSANPTQQDFQRATGFIGTNAKTTKNENWNGLTNQLWRCIRHSAWYAGVAPKQLFGFTKSLYPTKIRFNEFVLSAPYVFLEGGRVKHTCSSIAEYVQLMYTDHLVVLDDNDKILADSVAPYFRN